MCSIDLHKWNITYWMIMYLHDVIVNDNVPSQWQQIGEAACCSLNLQCPEVLLSQTVSEIDMVWNAALKSAKYIFIMFFLTKTWQLTSACLAIFTILLDLAFGLGAEGGRMLDPLPNTWKWHEIIPNLELQQKWSSNKRKVGVPNGVFNRNMSGYFSFWKATMLHI